MDKHLKDEWWERSLWKFHFCHAWEIRRDDLNIPVQNSFIGLQQPKLFSFSVDFLLPPMLHLRPTLVLSPLPHPSFSSLPSIVPTMVIIVRQDLQNTIPRHFFLNLLLRMIPVSVVIPVGTAGERENTKENRKALTANPADRDRTTKKRFSVPESEESTGRIEQ